MAPSSSDSVPVIRLEGVEKVYSGRDGDPSLRALAGVNLSVQRGESVGIIGASGAGKSTLIRTINLLERPSAGRVWIGDREITGLSERELIGVRREIGMIFQHFNLLSSKTVAENVAWPLRLAGDRPEMAIKQRVEELLVRVGLAGEARKYPVQLSGGQKQRVGIARALATKPQVLLCDEATSALDPETTQSVLRLLAELNRELGITLVFITHEMEVARRLGDRIAVIDAGRIVEEGAVANVFLHPKHPTTRRLVLQAERIDEEEQYEDFAHVPGRVVRITFQGDMTYRPMLGEVARATGVDFSILAGRIDRIRETPYGQLTLAFTGAKTDDALQRLAAAGARIEEVRR